MNAQSMSVYKKPLPGEYTQSCTEHSGERPMKLYVPHLGDELRLTADWNFTLYNEYRNSTLVEWLGWRTEYTDANQYAELMKQRWKANEQGWWNGAASLEPVAIPQGTVLKIKRIFIRQGMPDYDSITFACKLPHGPKGKLKPLRFWAKLDDCNNIEFTKVN